MNDLLPDNYTVAKKRLDYLQKQLTKMYNILLRFRAVKFGLVADIKQAFLQIEITEDHRHLLRFLWFKNINNHLHLPCCDSPLPFSD